MDLQAFKQEVIRLDPKLETESDTFKAAVCLLASLQLGASYPRIARFTGYQRGLVRSFSARLKESGVWVNEKVHCEWFDENHGGISFWLDVAVAQGLVRRVKIKRSRVSRKTSPVYRKPRAASTTARKL